MGKQDWHCIYPQPGADVAALPEQWQERAEEILRDYKPNGPKHQGCCCAYGSHRLLHNDEAQRLTDAGFLVEAESEWYDDDYYPSAPQAGHDE